MIKQKVRWLNCKAPLEMLLEQHALVLEVTNTKGQLPTNVMKRLRNSGLERWALPLPLMLW